MTRRLPFWIAGTVIGLVGVACVRLIAPQLAGASATAASVAGYFLVIFGIAALGFATQRKSATGFTTADNGESAAAPR